ncbi:MAG TPA: cupin [Verrucomicrobiales bacterium]|jgi:oxalate decarboxylase/phosphoglucose isomerase-like protein (cupin superfamily)|nr:cupin [Verrucomicrobiales bacterium]
MDIRFEAIQNHPANQVFHVVFFPDRIYHAQYLNATRSARYTYNVQEVRAKVDATVLKGNLRLDEQPYTNFIRLEYRAGRLTEQARLKYRFVGEEVIAWVRLHLSGGRPTVEGRVTLGYCPWVDAYQCEIWQTLEVPQGQHHDYQVLAQMGIRGTITRIPAFAAALEDPKGIMKVELAFREGRANQPMGYGISDADAGWDNFFGRNVQMPRTAEPSSGINTVPVENYEVDFQRGWYVADVEKDVAPVRYRNAMMMDSDLQKFADRFFGGDMQKMNATNITDMRWVFQQELGGSLVFFHEVTVPVGGVEGTHQHIGSEELYYVVAGEGIGYMAEGDDPKLTSAGTYIGAKMPVFGLDEREMREVPMKPGSVIFTKSGGMHGIRNTGSVPLKFVAFLYHAH